MSGQSPAKKAESGRWREEQLERRPPPAAATSGNPYGYAETNLRATTGTLNGSQVVDLDPAATTTFKTNSALLSLFNDTGKTPLWGIRVPANYLARVITSLMINSLTADGVHQVSWIIDGSYTVSKFGPVEGVAQSSSFSATGVRDDLTLPDSLYHLAHMGDTLDWTVGIFHDWFGWTNDPKDFRYGISVELVGTLPT